MAQTPDKRFIYVTVGRANEIAMIDVETNKVATRVPRRHIGMGRGDRGGRLTQYRPDHRGLELIEATSHQRGE